MKQLNRRGALALSAATLAATRSSWAVTPKGPGLILPEGPAGSWDSERTSCPRVLRDTDGSWRMWYYGRDPAFDDAYTLPTGRVGLATSPDGIRWERVKGPLTLGAVLEPSDDPARFDSGHVGVGSVLRDNDQYVMWYFGGDRSVTTTPRGTSKGFPLRPGRAVSTDGVTWTKTDGPVRGAYLDNGKPGEFDAAMVGWPQVFKDTDGAWRMYYHTLSAAEGFMACGAVSADGLKWEKIGPVLKKGPEGNFDDAGVASRQVIKLGGRYVMFYEGNNGQRFGAIGMAESPDGVNFTRVKGPDTDGSMLALAPIDSGRFDTHGIGTPWVVPNGKGFFLYYVGATIPGDTGDTHNERAHIHRIGLAINESGDLTTWKRWEN
ncbi:MAG: hypothetical protein SFV19_08710 [Rhodospirillaceae bacterium]|nr:hypothetical protein [Rhodospirillaceae bacterium]